MPTTSSPAAGEPWQVVVMGVSGSGKSQVGIALAARLGWDFIEGDDLHPEANVAKMAAGQPLTDDDRAPWLDEINARARGQHEAARSSIITCSALRRSYRERLRDGITRMLFLHLHGTYEVLEPRMQHRERHFMPTSLLRSQFETLEPLEEEELGVVVDVSGTVDEVTDTAAKAVDERLRV